MIFWTLLEGLGLGLLLILVCAGIFETARWAWCTCIMRTCRPGARNWP